MKLSSQLLILSGAQAYTGYVDWRSSRDACKDAGTSLPVPTNEEEVASLCTLVPGGSGDSHVWLGIKKTQAEDGTDYYYNAYTTEVLSYVPLSTSSVWGARDDWECIGLICFEGDPFFTNHDCDSVSDHDAMSIGHTCDTTIASTNAVTIPTTTSAAMINVGTGGRTWQEAVDVCAAEGKTLPIPRSEAEVNELCTLSPNTHVWTGVIKGDDPDTYLSYVDRSPAPYLLFVGNCPTCNCPHCTTPNPLTPSEKCMALICYGTGVYAGSQNQYTFMDHDCETKGTNFISFCNEPAINTGSVSSLATGACHADLMEYGFSGCEYEMGPLLKFKDLAYFDQVIADDVAGDFIGFTFQPLLGYGKMIMSLEAGCEAPKQYSWPLHLISTPCSRDEVPITVTTPTAPPSATTGLSCFHCDAPNFAECQRTGEMKQCLSNEETCEIEQRKRNGVVKQIHTGCKQELACKNNKKQNFTGKHKNWQCRPWKWNKKGPSVCRQCCNGSDSCATDFLSDAGWNSPSITTDGWAKNM